MREESSHICLEGKINSKKLSIIQTDIFGILTKNERLSYFYLEKCFNASAYLPYQK